MLVSAIFMGAAGLAATFLPEEIAAAIGAGGAVTLIVQVTGALYVANAMTNWMARESVIGGIYNRPLALGNFLHFTVAGLALIKAVAAGNHAPLLLAIVVIYAAFAVAFGVVLFTSPVKN